MNENSMPQLATAGPPRTAVRAAAPPGGWRHRVKDIAAIANDTPTPVAMMGSLIRLAASTPMMAEIVLPPMIDHGWASGLAGTANSSTAEAPIGATINGRCDPFPSR